MLLTGRRLPFKLISRSYIAHISTKQGTQGAEYIQTFKKVIAVMNSETLLLAPYIRVYKVLWCIQQPQSGTTGLTPSLFDKCTGFFYMRLHNTWDNGFTSQLKDEAMVKCLA